MPDLKSSFLPRGFLAASCVALKILVMPAAVKAADTPTPASTHQTDPLASARQAIAQQRWATALAELRKSPAPTQADWHNLMGYALRKQSAPDLEAAQRHYDSALRIEPDHKGALEYAGELALVKNELEVAERYLSRLVRVCPQGCEERADLERAMAQFKRDGRRNRP